MEQKAPLKPHPWWWIGPKSFWFAWGKTIYHPKSVKNPEHDIWAAIREHEAVHIRQQKRFTLIGFALLYFLFPLPVGLSYMRWRFEREAYLVSIRLTTAPNTVARYRRIRQIATSLSSWRYGWAWPRKWIIDWLEQNS